MCPFVVCLGLFMGASSNHFWISWEKTVSPEEAAGTYRATANTWTHPASLDFQAQMLCPASERGHGILHEVNLVNGFKVICVTVLKVTHGWISTRKIVGLWVSPKKAGTWLPKLASHQVKGCCLLYSKCLILQCPSHLLARTALWSVEFRWAVSELCMGIGRTFFFRATNAD